MNRAIIQVIANSAAVVVAARLIPGISYHGGLLYLLLVGIVIGLINLVVKPVVVFLSCPLIVLSLGLFYLIVNGLMLAL
ncbi:MAG TPA: phage holin family protein, partial [Thermoanaerobaculia bacterium]|nr:phage holin family protein [Thermoanaerobaculia bacterium]